MKFIFYSLLLFVTACVQHKGDQGKEEVVLSFFTRGAETGITMEALKQFPVERCQVPKPVESEVGLMSLTLVQTALVGTLTNALTKTLISGVEKWSKRFTAQYAGSVNMRSFNLGRGGAAVRCVGIFRVQPGSVDEGTKDSLRSAVVFEILSAGNSAMFVRPVYVYIPHLKAATGVSKGQIGVANVAVTVAFSTVNADRELVSFSQSFSLKPYQSDVESHLNDVRATASPWVFAKDDATLDTAIMPYFPGRPITLSVAVSEIGAGAREAKAVVQAITDNKSILSDLIGGTLTGGLE